MLEDPGLDNPTGSTTQCREASDDALYVEHQHHLQAMGWSNGIWNDNDIC